MSFEKASSVNAVGNHYEAHIADGWDILGNANGGYLMALGARAMAEASRPHPFTVTAHFLSPGMAGPISIHPETLKTGRRLNTMRASVRGPEKTIIELLGSFGEVEDVDGAVLVDAQPPELPSPEQCCHIIGSEKGFPPPIVDRLEMRLHPDDASLFQGQSSGKPVVRGWARLLDNEPVDAFGLMLIADAFPPTIFNARLPVAWVPTVEMTVQIRAIPAKGWLRCKFSTRFITGGMLEEDGEIWDSNGRLVALSRQLALLPRG